MFYRLALRGISGSLIKPIGGIRLVLVTWLNLILENFPSMHLAGQVSFFYLLIYYPWKCTIGYFWKKNHPRVNTVKILLNVAKQCKRLNLQFDFKKESKLLACTKQVPCLEKLCVGRTKVQFFEPRQDGVKKQHPLDNKQTQKLLHLALSGINFSLQLKLELMNLVVRRQGANDVKNKL